MDFIKYLKEAKQLDISILSAEKFLNSKSKQTYQPWINIYYPIVVLNLLISKKIIQKKDRLKIY